MTGLALVKDKCKAHKLDEKLCTDFLKEVLKLGDKDLRCAPLVKTILASMEGKTREQISSALEITRKKSIESKEFIHPNYFIAVLKKSKSPDLISQSYDGIIENLNWGKSL